MPKLPKVIKATPEERAAYALTGPVYPLSHWVTVDGQRCAVEACGTSHPNDPRYEIILPKGFHVAYEWLHTLLCLNLADVRERAASVSLVPCGPDCD